MVVEAISLGGLLVYRRGACKPLCSSLLVRDFFMSLSDARRQSHRSNLVGRCLPLIGQVAEAASSAAAAVFFVLCAMNDDTARSAQCKIACQTHPVIQWRRDVTGAPAYTAGNSEISQGVPAAIRACNFWPCSSDCPVTAKLRWFASKWTFGDQSASQWPSQTRYAPDRKMRYILARDFSIICALLSFQMDAARIGI